MVSLPNLTNPSSHKCQAKIVTLTKLLYRAITRDESIYPDADAFNPGRWIDPQYPTYKEPLTLHPNLNGFSQFGFGRRTCQGIPIVDQDLFLTMGGMAWAFNICKKRRADGTEVPVHWNDYTPLLIAKPVPFEFDATVRDEEKQRILTQMWETGKGEDDEEEERSQMTQEKETEKPLKEEKHDGLAKGVPDVAHEREDDVGSDRGSETSGGAGSLTGSLGSVSTGSDSEGEGHGLRAPLTVAQRCGGEDKRRMAFVSIEVMD